MDKLSEKQQYTQNLGAELQQERNIRRAIVGVLICPNLPLRSYVYVKYLVMVGCIAGIGVCVCVCVCFMHLCVCVCVCVYLVRVHVCARLCRLYYGRFWHCNILAVIDDWA